LFGQQVTPRSLYGLVVLGALLGIYLIVLLSGLVSTQRERAQELATELALMEDLEAQTIWRDRMKQTSEMLEQWAGHVWQAASPGIAAAQIDSDLRSLGQATGIENLRTDVSAVTSVRDGIPYIRFELSGAITSDQIPVLFASLAASKKMLVLDDVRMTTRQENNTTVQMSGIAPFRQVAAPEE
jgi:hypothetical protein